MIVSMLVYWLLTALVLMVVDALLPGIAISSFGTAMLAAFLMGVVNFFVKPLLSLLTLPLNIVTLGLFSFVINAILFALVAWMVPGFEVSNFLSALAGSLILALMTGFLGSMLPNQQTPVNRV
jgi:putative membrane protein